MSTSLNCRVNSSCSYAFLTKSIEPWSFQNMAGFAHLGGVLSLFTLFSFSCNAASPSSSSALDLINAYMNPSKEFFKVLSRNQLIDDDVEIMSRQFEMAIFTAVDAEMDFPFMGFARPAYKVLEFQTDMCTETLMNVARMLHSKYRLHRWLVGRYGRSAALEPLNQKGIDLPKLPKSDECMSKNMDTLVQTTIKQMAMLKQSIAKDEIRYFGLTREEAVTVMSTSSTSSLQILSAMHDYLESLTSCMNADALHLVSLYKYSHVHLRTAYKQLSFEGFWGPAVKRTALKPVKGYEHLQGKFSHVQGSSPLAHSVVCGFSHVFALPKPVFDMFPLFTQGNLTNLDTFILIEDSLFDYHVYRALNNPENVEISVRVIGQQLEHECFTAVDSINGRLFTSNIANLTFYAMQSFNADALKGFALHVIDEHYLNPCGMQHSLDYELKRLLAIRTLKEDCFGADKGKYDEIFKASLGLFTRTIKTVALFNPQIVDLTPYAGIIKELTKF